MTPPSLDIIANLLHISTTGAGLLIILLFAWSIYWKAKSLWLSATHRDKIWFIILLIINTAGILDIIYIYLLAKPGDPEYVAKE